MQVLPYKVTPASSAVSAIKKNLSQLLEHNESKIELVQIDEFAHSWIFFVYLRWLRVDDLARVIN